MTYRDRLVERFPLVVRGRADLAPSYARFIVSASYERRGQVASSQFLQHAERALVVDYVERDEGQPRDAEALRALLAERCDDVRIETWSLNDIEHGAVRLREWLGTRPGAVCIDMTTLTKPYLFVLLDALSQIEIDEADMLYTEPSRYSARRLEGRPVFGAGQTTVRFIPGYSRAEAQSERRPTLVLNGGFEWSRAKAVIETVAPRQLVFMYGYPSFRPGMDDLALTTHSELFGHDSPYDLIAAPAHDPFRTAELLTERLSGYPRPCIATPLGSKPQALGIALAHFCSEWLNVIYHFPAIYLAHSSDEYSQTFLYRLPLPNP